MGDLTSEIAPFNVELFKKVISGELMREVFRNQLHYQKLIPLNIFTC
jgi:hypothetical protein